MSYDPAWDMPQPNWQQQGSFEQGSIPPITEPDAGTQVCLGPIAREWLPWVAGACDQLRNPSAWIVADDTAMYNTLRRVDTLLGLLFGPTDCFPPVMMRLTGGCVLQFSNDGGVNWVDTTDWVTNFGNCVRSDIPVPVPIDPNPALRDQHACNISGYIAQKFIEITMQKVVTYVGTSGDQLAFATSVMGSLAGVFPLTAGFVNGLYRFYNLVVAQLLAEVSAAAADSALWSEVTCVIYTAIRLVGYVDASNFAAVQAGLYAISYTSAWVPLALGNYWGDLGLVPIQELQNVGAIDVIDCTGCLVNWCTRESYNLSQGCSVEFIQAGSRPTTYTPGIGWVGGYNAGNNTTGCDVLTYFADCGGTTPVGINGVVITYDNPGPAGDLEFSYYNSSTGIRAASFSVPANSSGTITDTFSVITVTTLVAQLFYTGTGPAPTIQALQWTGNAASNPRGGDSCP